MEENQYRSDSLFSLSIDPVTKTHLSETAKWARFLAIVGMIAVALMVVGGVLYSIWITTTVQSLEDRYQVRGNTTRISSSIAVAAALWFIIIATIAFFPFMYMLRFANRMKTAINANDQESLNTSFQNLKIYFRYLGIITIIGLGLWVFWIVMVGLVAVNR